MSFFDEFYKRLSTSPFDKECVMLDRCTLANRRLNEFVRHSNLYWYHRICNTQGDIVCKLPKHYYHQSLDVFAKQWFYERLDSCLIFLPELTSIMVCYLFSG